MKWPGTDYWSNKKSEFLLTYAYSSLFLGLFNIEAISWRWELSDLFLNNVNRYIDNLSSIENNEILKIAKLADFVVIVKSPYPSVFRILAQIYFKRDLSVL